MLISWYQSTFDKNNTHVDPLSVIDFIKSSQMRDLVLYLRSLGKNEYKAEKTSRLPAVTWSGTFPPGERSIDKLSSYSQIICMDFDKMDEDKVRLVKTQLANDVNVLCCFTSPSNNGIKVLVTIDSPPEHHRTAWLNLADYFLKSYFIEADRSGKDVSRLCYLSWDEDLIYNPNASTFHVEVEKYAEVFTEYKKTASESINDEMADHAWKVATKWIEGRNSLVYTEGQRNLYIYYISCALNRVGVLLETTVNLVDKYLQTPDRKWLQSVNSAYKHHIAEHGSVPLAMAASGVSEFVPSPCLAEDNTDDVVVNDLVSKAMLLMFLKAPMNEMMDILTKLHKFYDKLGYMGIGAPDVLSIAAKARDNMNKNMANNAAQFAMPVHTIDSALTEVSNMDFTGVMPVHIPKFDEALGGGIYVSNVYGLIGFGETYKSIVAQYMQVCDAAMQIPTLYLNGEMSVVQYLERAVKMTLGKDLRPFIRNKDANPEALAGIIDEMKNTTGGYMMFHSGLNFNKNSILATLDQKYAETGKKIKKLYIDGIGQMEWLSKEEISSNITNSYVLKEIAKEAYNGEGVAIICLMHCSGPDLKTLRNTSVKVRGGVKITANLDGYFCTSLFIDPDSVTDDNPDDFSFLTGKFHLLMNDKRTGALQTRATMEVGANLHICDSGVDPKLLEINIKKQAAKQSGQGGQSY